MPNPRRLSLFLAPLMALLLGCASPDAPAVSSAPQFNFKLTPAALGRSLAWQQQLRISVDGKLQPPLQALLEADAHQVQLAVLATGRLLARLRWDGERLDAERFAGWPAQIEPERVLSDLQLALWPLGALRAALPADATLTQQGSLRLLRQQGQALVSVRGAGSEHIEIEHHRLGYVLVIDSVPLEGEIR